MPRSATAKVGNAGCEEEEDDDEDEEKEEEDDDEDRLGEKLLSVDEYMSDIHR